MNSVCCESRFHPVGQGLFYSSFINDKYFVYDCGSVNKLELNDCIEAFEKKKIDLLVISHFDNDHINGISKLLSYTGGAKEVVIPYIGIYERFWLFGKKLSDNDELTSFVANPAKWLNDNGCDKVIQLSPGSVYKQTEEDDGYREGWDGTKIDNPSDSCTDDPSFTITMSSQATCYTFFKWSFRFFCHPYKIGIPVDDIIEELKSKGLFPIDAHTISGNIENIKKVYEGHIEYNTNRNYISIICAHGPRKQNNYKMCFCESIYGSFNCDKFLIKSSQASFCDLQILTGDAHIDLEMYKKWLGKDLLSQCFLFQVPHHGANESWNNSFINIHPNCREWIVSAGLTKKLKARKHHPGCDIKNTGLYYYHVHQKSSFDLYFEYCL